MPYVYTINNTKMCKFEKKITLCGLFGSYRYVMENVDF